MAVNVGNPADDQVALKTDGSSGVLFRGILEARLVQFLQHVGYALHVDDALPEHGHLSRGRRIRPSVSCYGHAHPPKKGLQRCLRVLLPSALPVGNHHLVGKPRGSSLFFAAPAAIPAATGIGLLIDDVVGQPPQ